MEALILSLFIGSCVYARKYFKDLQAFAQLHAERTDTE